MSIQERKGKGKVITTRLPLSFKDGNPLERATQTDINNLYESIRNTVWMIRVKFPNHEEMEEEEAKEEMEEEDAKEEMEIKDKEDKVDRNVPTREFYDTKFEYFYVAGVCINLGGRGFILTSKQILLIPELPAKFSECVFEGRRFDKEYQRLQLVMQSPYGEDYAMFRPCETSIQHDFAELHLGQVEVGSEAFVIGHPFTVGFPLIKGYITHCSYEYNENVVHKDTTFFEDRDFLTVKDILLKPKDIVNEIIGGRKVEYHVVEINGRSDMIFELELLPNIPLLSIGGVTHGKGLSGSPIFNANGLVMGVVSFGDGLFTYGMPSRFIKDSIDAKQRVLRKQQKKKI